ncbi:MAG TPA: hypothetical protein VEI74_02010 [Candidatus Methylomirabilis sp.]|nr:hypothetical protein [Candidatus Methylomirabilis sp.]
MIGFGRALLLVALFATAPVMADVWKFGGHVKFQYTYTDFRPDDINAVFGGDPAHDQNLDLRLNAENRTGPWEYVAHYELLAVAGDTLEARRRMAAAGVPLIRTVSGLPDDSRQLFDLTHETAERERLDAVQRLDRLYVGYSSARRTLRVGRQAVTWGNGLVFQPLDFVNPFSPIAIDKDYKTGEDMLYGQWLVSERSDVEAMVVPRRNPSTDSVESDQSSYAIKYRFRVTGVDIDLLAARHFAENLAGLGVVKSVGGAVWRMDLSYTSLEDGGNATSLVTNMDYSWMWGGKNVYGYAEYFHSGVGESERANYATPNVELSDRLARGELFTLARDYGALGLQVELTPLFNLFTSFIANLNDGSKYFQLRGVYDWQQDVQLMAGLNMPSGSRGTEYGGVPVAGTDSFASAGKSVYLRGAYYF